MLKQLLCATGLLLLPIHVLAQGPLIWEVQEDFHVADDSVAGITLSGKSAVIIGNTRVPREGTELVAQALHKATGIIRWTAPQGVCCTPDDLQARPDIESRRNIAVIAGNGEDPARHVNTLRLRAYDVPTGTLMWEDEWTGAPDAVDAKFGSLAVGPTAVVVTASGRRADRPGSNVFFLGVYDLLTGVPLWGARFDALVPELLAINRNRVFVAGRIITPGLDERTLLVRAYDVQSGGVDWEVTRPNWGNGRAAIKLAAGRLFVAGSLGVGASSIPYLGALSARTGAPLWENTALPGGPLGSSFVDIAFHGSRVVGVLLNHPIAVQAYDVTTGMLEWQAPDLGALSFSIGLNDDAVYFAGIVFNPAPGTAPGAVYSELMVRAYAASTGALLWEDRSHPSTVSPFINRVLTDVALDKSRLFVVGYTIDEDHSQGFPRHALSGQDFLIRAYDIRSDSTTTQD